jgi:uncharacterized membrane protein YuzA (DUF378 family)
MKKVAWWLVIIGALNWGVIGVGLAFFNRDLNVVTMLFGYGLVAKIIYLLVGLSALYTLFGHCGCRRCRIKEGSES